MKEITVMGSPLFLRDGIVRLTKKQASDRKTCLKPHLDKKGKQVKDCYEIIAETCFKVGETIGYAGNIDSFRPEAMAQKSEEKDIIIEDLKASVDEKDIIIGELKARVEELEKMLAETNKAKTDNPKK